MIVTNYCLSLLDPRDLYVPITARGYGLQSWNLSKVSGVTPIHSCGHISEWGQTLIEYTYLLVIMTPIIIFLNLLLRFPCSGLVINFPAILVVGHHSTETYFLFI